MEVVVAPIMALWPYASDTSRSAFGTENSCYRQEHPLQVTDDMLVIAGDYEFSVGFDLDMLYDGWPHRFCIMSCIFMRNNRLIEMYISSAYGSVE